MCSEVSAGRVCRPGRRRHHEACDAEVDLGMGCSKTVHGTANSVSDGATNGEYGGSRDVIGSRMSCLSKKLQQCGGLKALEDTDAAASDTVRPCHPVQYPDSSYTLMRCECCIDSTLESTASAPLRVRQCWGLPGGHGGAAVAVPVALPQHLQCTGSTYKAVSSCFATEGCCAGEQWLRRYP